MAYVCDEEQNPADMHENVEFSFQYNLQTLAWAALITAGKCHVKRVCQQMHFKDLIFALLQIRISEKLSGDLPNEVSEWKIR